MANKKTYEVEVLKTEGTCKDELFSLMAENGDLTATKIHDIMGMEVTIKGYAETHIKTAEKEFDILYVDTDEYGLVSAGSDIFKESVEKYFGKVSRFIIKAIKTKAGNTYKASPLLGSKKVENNETDDDLPF